MSQITVVLSKNLTAALPTGVTYAATAIVVVDNSGVTLPAVTVNGSESPPWTAVFTGTDGPSEATATATDLDTSGNTIGTPVTATESGTGGQPGTFPQTTGLSITVTG
jgi:hypothetical protein